MGWPDMPPSAGWTCLTPGVSFLKTLKRKTKTKVCNLDLEEMQDSQLPVLALGSLGTMELGCRGGGASRFGFIAYLLYRLLDLF